MCGITGFLDFGRKSHPDTLHRMVKTLEHRGPDNLGVYEYVGVDYNLGLGHSRLSIIDMSENGNQPMVSSCGNYVIVFNGEIYNYKELRKSLNLENLNSDTAVLLALFRKKGIECVHDLIGMFAFLIFDKTQNKIFAFRDRIGIKPFYYYFSNDLFLFGSELKALLIHPKFKKELNPGAVEEYFSYGYISAPRSIYNNTFKLQKGHILELDISNRKIRLDSYWNIKKFFLNPKLTASEESIEEQLLFQFKRALEYRLVSDVPVGVFLSGGYDSTLICSLLSKEFEIDIQSFTIGFDEKDFDESVSASKIAECLKIQNKHQICTENDAKNLVELIPKIYDEPFSDPSAIPTLLVSQLAASELKVVLSGDGGDENFAGYTRYKGYSEKIQKVRRLALNNKKIGRKISKLLELSKIDSSQSFAGIINGSVENYMKKASSHLSPGQLKTLFSHETQEARNTDLNGLILQDQILYWDLERYLPDNVLVKVDRASMHFGLESREPLLDHQLMEFAATLPFSYKLKNGISKFPIRELVHHYIPKKLIDFPKKGFSPPISKWLNGVFKEEYLDLTSGYNRRYSGFQEIDNFSSILKSTKPEYLKYRLMWSMYIFQKWYDHWIK